MHGALLVAKLRARYPELNPTPGTVPSGTIASPPLVRYFRQRFETLRVYIMRTHQKFARTPFDMRELVGTTPLSNGASMPTIAGSVRGVSRRR